MFAVDRVSLCVVNEPNVLPDDCIQLRFLHVGTWPFRKQTRPCSLPPERQQQTRDRSIWPAGAPQIASARLMRPADMIRSPLSPPSSPSPPVRMGNALLTPTCRLAPIFCLYTLFHTALHPLSLPAVSPCGLDVGFGDSVTWILLWLWPKLLGASWCSYRPIPSSLSQFFLLSWHFNAI